MANFPQRWVDDVELWSHELVIAQVGNELQGAGPHVSGIVDRLGSGKRRNDTHGLPQSIWTAYMGLIGAHTALSICI
jgi:hypothetical protein